jgi:hypothetical protein
MTVTRILSVYARHYRQRRLADSFQSAPPSSGWPTGATDFLLKKRILSQLKKITKQKTKLHLHTKKKKKVFF